MSQPSVQLFAPASARDSGAAPSWNPRQLLLGMPFILVHFAPLAAIWTGTRTIDWVVCFALYVVRMFGVTGVYHRYFAHRTYRTSRWFQLVLAFIAMSSSQRGALWWASHHRHHHRASDQPTDLHSPRQSGLLYAHVGWLFNPRNTRTDFDGIKDFAKYPELVFLDKFWYLPPLVLAATIWLTLGWSGLLIGFMLSTVLLWHGTFTINSLSHVWGKKVYETGDDSKNSMVLALITLGEGWHNNHHYYQSCTRQGFHWWQLDITYYILRGLQRLGLVWDIREPPAEVVAGTWKRSVAAEVI